MVESTVRIISGAMSVRICAERAKAGGDLSRCPTCGRPASMPYRRWRGEEVVEGCIDPSHEPTMSRIPETRTAAWHYRSEAVAHRRDALEMIRPSLRPGA